MKINESNFVEELSHRNEKALEYVMVHYGGLVKSVTHRYLNVLSQYEEECINDVFFAVWEHIDSYDSARNPFANWIGGIPGSCKITCFGQPVQQLRQQPLPRCTASHKSCRRGARSASRPGTSGSRR